MGRKLDGAVVVVTGASSGIGRATGLAFAERGARVVVAARRADALEDLAQQCEAAGGQALVVPTDMTDEAAVAALARRAVERFGRIDIGAPWLSAYVSSKKYAIRGGCDQVPTRLAAQLQGQIQTDRELVAVRQRGGTVTLTFRQGTPRTVVVDKVVLALPFSILRSSVDVSGAGFQPLKQTAIAELGMGTNSKLHVQFSDRHWQGLGCNGETFADRRYQNTWDESRAQGGRSGILVNYTGGAVGASFGSGSPASRARQFLAQLEPVLPGITAKWNGRATVDLGLGNPWTKGSYSFWKVGQYTRFAGVDWEPEGNVHFAGEHTSVDFQGYLNGAVETGQRAAQELLSA